MKVTLALFLSNVVALLPLAAQTPQASYAGQTWVGLLVSDSCSQATPSPDAEADLSTTDRVTTPAVDDAGVRGAAAGREAVGGLKVPFTGDIESSRKDKADPGWSKAKRQASHLPTTCKITGSTTRFALVLPDGRQLRFDQLGNQKLAARLKDSTGAQAKPRILRAVVTGKLQDDAIAIDTVDL